MSAFTLQANDYPLMEGFWRFFRRRPTQEEPVSIKVKERRTSYEITVKPMQSLCVDSMSYYTRDNKLYITGIIPVLNRTFTLNPQRSFLKSVDFPKAIDEASLEASYSTQALFITLKKKTP